LAIPISIILVGLLYLGIHLLLVNFDPSIRMYKDVLQEAKRKLAVIRLSERKITNTRIRSLVGEIIGITEEVIKFTQNKNSSLSDVRRMLTFYLDNTSEILEKYSSIQGQKYIDQSTTTVLNRVEEYLGAVKINFEAQFNKLLKNDLDDMSVKMEVVKEMINWEEGK
jgi:5-bromo-4-chloroindolyl phosphate hydrolysis protein